MASSIQFGFISNAVTGVSNFSASVVMQPAGMETEGAANSSPAQEPDAQPAQSLSLEGALALQAAQKMLQCENEGVALLNAGRNEQAIGRFLEGCAIANHPTCNEIKVRLWLHMGKAYYQMEELEKAISCYRNGVLLLPQVQNQILKVKAVCNYAGILVAEEIEESVDEAIDLLETVFEQTGAFLKQNDQPLLARAIQDLIHGLVIRQAEGDIDKLIKYATAGLQLEQDDNDLKAWFFHTVGHCSMELGDFFKAFNCYEKACALPDLTDEELITTIKEERLCALNKLLNFVQSKLMELQPANQLQQTPENYCRIAGYLQQAAILVLKRNLAGDREAAVLFLKAALKQPHNDEALRKEIVALLLPLLTTQRAG